MRQLWSHQTFSFRTACFGQRPSCSTFAPLASRSAKAHRTALPLSSKQVAQAFSAMGLQDRRHLRLRLRSSCQRAGKCLLLASARTILSVRLKSIVRSPAVLGAFQATSTRLRAGRFATAFPAMKHLLAAFARIAFFNVQLRQFVLLSCSSPPQVCTAAWG